MAATGVAIDAALFYRRAQLLIAHIKNARRYDADSNALGQVGGVLVRLGVNDESLVYQKSTALSFWLFGYEFPETLIAISAGHADAPDGAVAILTSPKKAGILEALLVHAAATSGLPVVTLLRRAKDASPAALHEALWQCLSAGGSTPCVGVLAKDRGDAPILAEWDAFVAHAHAADGRPAVLLDVAHGLADLLVYKDDDEAALLRSAARCSALVMRDYVVDALLGIIDDERRITHAGLADKIEAVLAAPDAERKRKGAVRFPADVQTDYLEMCYPPIVQSGGVYNLRPSATSNDDLLHFGTVLVSLGVRYKSYCSNVARSFLIAPNKQQERDYKFLLAWHAAVLAAMRPGALLRDVHACAVAYVAEHRPDLTAHLPATFGFSTGLEFREADYVIGAKGDKALAAGMVFCLSLGLQDIPNAEPPKTANSSKKDATRHEKYSLLLVDTVYIGKAGPAILTDATKRLEDVSFFFKDAAESDAAAGRRRAAALASDGADTGAVLKSRLRSQTKTAVDENALRKRDAHQHALLETLRADSLAKYSGLEDDGTTGGTRKSNGLLRDVECYKRDAGLPRDLKEGKIHVDRRADAIVVPIYGLAVPFHISTIKNVSKSDEGEFVYLRINFASPGRPAAGAAPTADGKDAAQFVRAVTYRSADTFHLNAVYKEMAELRKALATKEAERKEMADLVTQDVLVEIKGKRPVRLGEVYMRPAMEGKRVPGDLEIHTNGLRYRNMIRTDQKADILYGNIKHVFFQPCDNEMIVLLHFHLKHPILVGKKKTRDVQFYREALEAIVDETGARRGTARRRGGAYGDYDEDEILQEQEERKKRAALNTEFKTFCERLLAAIPEPRRLDLDIPIRELGFYGVPHRQNVLLQPTRDCLVHLTDPPFLVISLADVEVASLERILFGLKNFDLVFVFKDHSLPVQHIDAIPMQSLEAIKDWLDANDLYYIQSNINFNWNNVLKTIREDPVGFYDMGAWAVIQADSGKAGPMDGTSGLDEEPSESDTEDSVYDEEDDDDEEDEDEEESDAKSDEEDESEYEDDEEDASEEEEEGEDWDALEEKTRQEEARLARDKRAAAAKGPAGPKRPVSKPAALPPLKKRK